MLWHSLAPPLVVVTYLAALHVTGVLAWIVQADEKEARLKLLQSGGAGGIWRKKEETQPTGEKMWRVVT